MISSLLRVFVACALLAPGLAAADGVRHLPPAEAEAGAPLELVAEITDASVRNVTVFYRALGAAPWAEVGFTQAAGGRWVAAIPLEAVTPPGLEYYLASTPSVVAEGEAPAPVAEFATADAPHPVIVRVSARDARRARDLARAGGRRSRGHAAFEWVDFGQRRNAAGVTVPDRYYRVDLDFAYRLLTYPLEEIRIGYTRLEGVVPNGERSLPDDCSTAPQAPLPCRVDAGFKVGGWFELGLGLAEGIRFDGRGMFTATQGGFALGARGELRAGVADGNHLAAAVEYMADVGTVGSFRLGWATVPRVPMAMTVEITDLPSSERATGIRLLYDVFYPLPTGLRLGARVGYSARDQIIGGPSAGVSASYDFF
ncbi:MAG: hypothetical protein IPL61_05995 [Myxococcales bacterium]|nr:hypothetical protein [Myxococcales bacterium]